MLLCVGTQHGTLRSVCLYVTTPNIQTSSDEGNPSPLWLFCDYDAVFERLTYFLTYLARDFDFYHRLAVLYVQHVQQSVDRYHQTLDTVIGQE